MATIGFRCLQIAASTRHLLPASFSNSFEHSGRVITEFEEFFIPIAFEHRDTKTGRSTVLLRVAMSPWFKNFS